LVVAVAIGSGAFALRAQFSTPGVKQFHDPTTCPDCGRKLPHENAPCPWCQAKKIQEEIKAARGGGIPKRTFSATSKLTIAAGGFGLLLALAFWLARIRAAKVEEVSCYFKCPWCQRKLRYLARQGGRKGRCPRCQKDLLFPIST